MIVQCDNCGKSINRRPSYNRKHNFCCRRCYHEWRRGRAKPRPGKITVQCDNCDKSINRKPSRNRKHNFCCSKCYQEWQRGRAKPRPGKITMQCEACGGGFETHESKVKIGWGRFCSRGCQSIWQSSTDWRYIRQSSKVLVTCEVCNCQFKVKVGVAVNRRFCSIACTVVWRQTLSGKDNANFKNALKTFVCPACNIEFMAYASSRRGERAFCSSECYYAQGITGENHYMWRGGVSFLPYPSVFNERLKKAIRERDDYKCAICGEWGNHVHHIDADKQNCVSTNLVTLCGKCHPKTQHNRYYWEGRLSNVVHARSYQLY